MTMLPVSTRRLEWLLLWIAIVIAGALDYDRKYVSLGRWAILEDNDEPSLFWRRRRRRLRTNRVMDVQQNRIQEPSAAVTTATKQDHHLKQRILQSITEPVIASDVWEHLTGQEFIHHPDRLDALVKVGQNLAAGNTEWVHWTQQASQHDVEIWTGTSQREGYGAQAPWIKTRAVVPLTPREMVDLLMDSSRVKTYNKWSVGRTDLYTSKDGRTKIVKNKTRFPMVDPLVAVTLLHARPLGDDSWIVVSRAVGPNVADEDEKRSDILLGINVLEPYNDDSCRVTAVTHVYSTAVPAMLAQRMGVKSAVNFVRDIRKLRVPA